MPNITQVKSSHITHVGYDPATRCLDVYFNSGTYRYFNVKEDVYSDLLKAESVGRFVNRYVVNSYDCVKLPSAK